MCIFAVGFGRASRRQLAKIALLTAILPLQRDGICRVMSWTGPQIIWYAPKDAILHLLNR